MSFVEWAESAVGMRPAAAPPGAGDGVIMAAYPARAVFGRAQTTSQRMHRHCSMWSPACKRRNSPPPDGTGSNRKMRGMFKAVKELLTGYYESKPITNMSVDDVIEWVRDTRPVCGLCDQVVLADQAFRFVDSSVSGITVTHDRHYI